MIARIPATPAARMTIWIVAIYSVAQGIGLILGGYLRLGSPGYTIIRQVPWAPIVWGTSLVLFGATLLLSSMLGWFAVKAAALTGISAWCSCFAVGAFWATITIPTAGTTGGPVYLCLACTTAVLINVEEKGIRPRADPQLH